MKNFKKFLFAALMLTVLAPTFSVNASAVAMSSDEYVVTLETIEPRASVIVYKFRNFRGVRQYRRWNETLGRWVDPAWINLAI